ncbi:MAG TPA: class I adenylate-forming enzyme family protein [Acidimicrobiales bacterium]|nr:class I adenylate-forming enzyme family protein [Acidimicrobiales bacterium]
MSTPTLEGPPLESAGVPTHETLPAFLADACARFRSNEALVFDDPLAGDTTVRWRYSDLAGVTRRVARGLLAARVAPGDRVAIVMGNRPEAVAAVFGVTTVGAVAVPLSTFSSEAELAYIGDDAGITFVLSQARLLKRDLRSEVEAAFPGVAGAVVGLARPDGARQDGARHDGAGPLRSWGELLRAGNDVADGEVDARRARIDADDAGVIIYSSGTTAHPKGMVHSHAAHALQFRLQADVFGRNEATRLWTALPMFWTAGFDTAMGPTLAAGGCWVMQETFEPGAALALMAREKATEPYTLPHQTAALEEHPDWLTTDLSSLRCVYGKSGFARHPSVHGDPGWNMPVAYGLSETCASFATHRHDTPREILRASMGRLQPGNRLRVIDPDSGRALGPDEDGELAVAGATLMQHYVGRTPEQSLDADGFFRTGDVGFYDQQGYLHWTGRRTEMIKTGGANVSPAELEVQLRACPPVKLARVIGMPDDRLGQTVVLCAVLKDGATATADELRAFLRERVASYKVPRHVLFFSDGEVPMTGSENKVRDAELARMVEQRLAQSRTGASVEH